MSSVESLSTAGGCQLAERLGFNGAVATYKGVLTANLRNVCVVALDKSQFAHLPALSRFREEFDKILKANPEGIALAVDYDEEPGYIWAAFEYLKGMHLGSYIRDKGLPSTPDAVSVIANTVGALMGLHRIGVPHRIITPASIFIKDPGEVRLMHAGWAGLLLGVQGGPAHPCFMSNLPFLAPEVAAGGEGDFASDIYSLGANLYFLATGQPTMWGDDPVTLARSIASTPLDLSPIRDSVPWELAELLEEMLAFDPDERPLNLEALKERMDDLSEKLATEATVPEVAPEDGAASYSSLAATQQNVEYEADEPTPTEFSPEPEELDEPPEVAQPAAAPVPKPRVKPPAFQERSFEPPSSGLPPSLEKPGSGPAVGSYSEPISGIGYSDPQTDPETARLLQMAQSARSESYRLSQSDPEIQIPREEPDAPPAYIPPPLPAPIYSPPPPILPGPETHGSQGFSRKPLMLAALVILLLVVGVGVGAMYLADAFSSPSRPKETVTTPPTEPRPTVNNREQLRAEYDSTVQRLRQMAVAQRSYAAKFGVWVQSPDRLDEFAVSSDVLLDAWGTALEYRQRYVVSAGPDKKWDSNQGSSADDLWINSDTMELGGWSP
jgi:serine/threonine protein kinase